MGIKQTLAEEWEKNPELVSAAMLTINTQIEKVLSETNPHPSKASATSLNPDIDKGRNL